MSLLQHAAECALTLIISYSFPLFLTKHDTTVPWFTQTPVSEDLHQYCSVITILQVASFKQFPLQSAERFYRVASSWSVPFPRPRPSLTPRFTSYGSTQCVPPVSPELLKRSLEKHATCAKYSPFSAPRHRWATVTAFFGGLEANEITMGEALSPEINLIATHDPNGLNNGIFLLRVSQWAVSLFTAILAYRHYNPNVHLRFSEQSTMELLLADD